MYYLHVIVSNEGAIRFYEKNGYKNIKLLKKYYVIDKEMYDAYLLVKVIQNDLEEEEERREEERIELS